MGRILWAAATTRHRSLEELQTEQQQLVVERQAWAGEARRLPVVVVEVACVAGSRVVVA